jgi:hypothetical protein
LFFARTNPIFVAGARLKRRPFAVTRFRWNTGAAPKQAHRMKAVDAEFIGLLTLIDRFPPTAPGPRFSITLEYEDPATFTADVGSKV